MGAAATYKSEVTVIKFVVIKILKNEMDRCTYSFNIPGSTNMDKNRVRELLLHANTLTTHFPFAQICFTDIPHS